jgi:hypothetical protein
MGKSGQKKITKIVADQSATGVKAILKEPSEQGFVFGKRHHAIANVAGREDAVLAAQTPGAATVIGDGNNGGEIGDRAVRMSGLIFAANDVFFKTTQQGGQTGTAAQGHDAKCARATARCGKKCFRAFFQKQSGGAKIKFSGQGERTEVLTGLPRRAIFFRVQQLGETRIFLKESEVFIVAGVIAIFRFKLNGDLEIGHGGIRFAGQTIERGQSVMNVVGFRSSTASFIETFTGIVPAPDVHHGDTPLVMFVGGAGILIMRRLHALLGNFHVHASAVGQFFTGAFNDLFQFLFGAGKFLLAEE